MNTKAIIIGHWRNGASIREIADATGFKKIFIAKIIKDYETNNLTSTD